MLETQSGTVSQQVTEENTVEEFITQFAEPNLINDPRGSRATVSCMIKSDNCVFMGTVKRKDFCIVPHC